MYARSGWDNGHYVYQDTSVTRGLALSSKERG